MLKFENELYKLGAIVVVCGTFVASVCSVGFTVSTYYATQRLDPRTLSYARALEQNRLCKQTFSGSYSPFADPEKLNKACGEAPKFSDMYSRPTTGVSGKLSEMVTRNGSNL